MKIGDIKLPKSGLVLAGDKQVKAFEEKYWITFPKYYREYVTKVGEGVLGDCRVRVYPPWRIERDLEQWRSRIKQYWLWDRGKKLLPKDRALECIIVADTTEGDELVFHPTRPKQLFVLPRHSSNIHDAGTDLLSAVGWMLTSGKVGKSTNSRDFEPFDSRKTKSSVGDDKGIEDPEGESIDDIIELAKRWAKRHIKRNEARKEIRDWKPYIEDFPDRTIKLLHEGIVFEAKFPYQPGYLAVHEVSEKKSKTVLGTFSWNWAQDGLCSSGGLEPNLENIRKLRQRKKK